MNILILGGTGFLGRSCAQRLCKDNNVTVIGFCDSNSKKTAYESRNVDIQETDNLISIIKEKQIEIVMHLVSSLIPSSNYEHYLSDLQNIYIPTQKLLEYCSYNNVKFVYVSSGGAIYGNQHEIFSENTTREPVSYYGLSKLNFENLILFYHNMYNLKYIILRPSNPYGFGQNLYGKQGLIAVIIGKILNNETIEIWGDGSAIKDYIYIDDFTFYVSNLLNKNEAWNNTYNIGSGVGSSINEVLNAFMVNKISLPKIQYISSNKTDVKHMILNCSKIQELISHDCISLVDGIRRFYEDSIK